MAITSKELARQEAIYDAQAVVIGRANMAWNDVQTEVFLLFKNMARLNYQEADAVFFAIRTDSAQRDMTCALAKVVFAQQSDNIKELLGLINQVGKIAGQRNLAIHTAWIVSENETRLRPYMRHSTPTSLEPDSLTQFKALKSKLTILFVDMNKFRQKVFPDPPLATAPQPTMGPAPTSLENALLQPFLSSEPPPQSSGE